MNSYEEFFKLPGWEEIIRQIRFEISQAQRPAEEIILDDIELCNQLKISKRKSASMRDEREITYHQKTKHGKVYYKLSDVLEYINRFRIEANSNQFKSRIK